MRTTMLEAYYWNGAWAVQRASVVLDHDGRSLFCNGYADPMLFPRLSEAESAFYEFLADKKPASYCDMANVQ